MKKLAKAHIKHRGVPGNCKMDFIDGGGADKECQKPGLKAE